MKKIITLSLYLLLSANIWAQSHCAHSEPDKYSLYVKNFEKDSIDGFVSIPITLVVNDTISSL